VRANSFEKPEDVAALVEALHGVHRAAYGFDQPEAPAECVDFHLTLTVPVSRPEIAPAWLATEAGTLDGARLGERTVWFTSARVPVTTPVYRRDLLPSGQTLTGPAILEQLDSTTVVPPGWSVRGDRWGTLHMTPS
jgi:N-methylhydantoinase A